MMPAVVVEESLVMAALAERSGSSRLDCTDCSHCANRPELSDRAGVRISINLREFFSDHRARAFVWAPYGRCVRWLRRHVARLFGLPDDVALMSRGHILPLTEPLLILDRDDPVDVVNMHYVFNSQTNQDDSNPSQATTKHNAIRGRSGINIQQIQSNVQDKMRQLPTSSKSHHAAQDQNLSEIECPIKDTKPMFESMENQSLDVNEDLQRLKQHALRLLDEHCQMLEEGPAPKRLRRRRRRRRPLQAFRALSASDDEHPQDDGAATHAGAAVLRNGAGSRTPRIVLALSPSPVT